MGFVRRSHRVDVHADLLRWSGQSCPNLIARLELKRAAKRRFAVLTMHDTTLDGRNCPGAKAYEAQASPGAAG